MEGPGKSGGGRRQPSSQTYASKPTIYGGLPIYKLGPPDPVSVHLRCRLLSAFNHRSTAKIDKINSWFIFILEDDSVKYVVRPWSCFTHSIVRLNYDRGFISPSFAVALCARGGLSGLRG